MYKKELIEPKMSEASGKTSYNEFVSCIEACVECTLECKDCASQCLNDKDVMLLTRCIKLQYDCASLCLMAMEIMEIKTGYVRQIWKACEEACIACAWECEKHSDIPYLKKCAEVCRKCAIECSKMGKDSQINADYPFTSGFKGIIANRHHDSGYTK